MYTAPYTETRTDTLTQWSMAGSYLQSCLTYYRTQTLVGLEFKQEGQAAARTADCNAKKCRGSRDLGDAHFQGNYLCARSALPIQSDIPNLKSLAQIVFEILRSKRIEVTSLTFQGHETSSAM